MAGYWVRQRLSFTIIMCAIVALITSFLFVYPSIQQKANDYNTQSIYKNSEMDFIVPEPSFEQSDELPGTNGIEKVFPFYMTKTEVNVNETSRTTTVLLSDQFQNIDMTMYSPSRLIEKSGTEYDDPILVDWQFCQDTGAKIGDTVSLMIGGQVIDYMIYAVYETNTIYDGGAIIAKISEDQKTSIAEQSSNNGYSGMYICSDDYNVCQSYLTTEYRPLGRLRNRNQFSSDEQYQVHYDAIMSSGYANEITDFRIRENGLDTSNHSMMIWIGAILTIIVIFGFNIALSKRGCERVYFIKQRIPKGHDVKPYYSISFIFEMVFTILLYVVFMLLRLRISSDYIPKSAIGMNVVIIPVAVIIAEIISLFMNNSAVSEMAHKVEQEMQKAEENNKIEPSEGREEADEHDVDKNVGNGDDETMLQTQSVGGEH